MTLRRIRTGLLALAVCAPITCAADATEAADRSMYDDARLAIRTCEIWYEHVSDTIARSLRQRSISAELAHSLSEEAEALGLRCWTGEARWAARLFMLLLDTFSQVPQSGE